MTAAPTTETAAERESAAQVDTLAVYFSRVGNTDFPDDFDAVSSEGSSFSRTVSTIQRLEPDAEVIEGISIRGSAVPGSENTVRQFIHPF